MSSPRRPDKDGLVYSTRHGKMCPECGRPSSDCRCSKGRKGGKGRSAGADSAGQSPRPPQDGVVRVGRSTKGRKGKGVTVITGVPLVGDELRDFAKALKQKCGSGGAVKDDTIEIQGDHRDALVEELAKHGWTVKRSGG